MEIQITCFAGLRKFFEPQLFLTCPVPASYQSLLQKLKELNPEAGELLDVCRIAVNKEFVSNLEMEISGEAVFLIPPSSGG